MDYSPWGTVSEMDDVQVVFSELDEDLGWWDPDSRVITLDKRQTRREMRCTLAHELEHARRGDECVESASPILAVRQEIAASAAAARRLISLGRLVDALLWSQNEQELAEELNVDEDTLRVRLLTLTPGEHSLIDERLWQAEGRIA